MANQGTPVNFTDFTASSLSTSALKTTPRGAKVVWVNYGSGALFLQTPFSLKAPMGISKWENDNGPPTYEVLLSLGGAEGQAFAEKLEEMDTWVKEQAIKNSKTWFKKNIDNMVVVETLYNPTLRLPRDKETGEITDKYPPSFRAKIPMVDGRPACDTYEMIDGAPVMVDLMELMERKPLKGANMTAIVKCSGIWFPQKFSCSWQVQQLLIEPNAGSLRPCAFVGLNERVAAAPFQAGADSSDYPDENEVEPNLE